MNEAAANGLPQALGFTLTGGLPGALADGPAPREEYPAGFSTVLGTYANADPTAVSPGNPLPTTGGELPVVPSLPPVQVVDNIDDPRAALTQASAVEPLEVRAGADRSADTIGQWLSATGRSPVLPVALDTPPGTGQVARPATGHADSPPADVMVRDAAGTRDPLAGQSLAIEPGHRTTAPALAHQHPGPQTGQIELQGSLARYFQQQTASRDSSGRRDQPGVSGRDPGLAAATTGLTTVQGNASGPGLVARPVLEQPMTQATGGSVENTEPPDLPFESIRISVRDPVGERSAPRGSTPLELPAPRHPMGHPEWARSLGERLVVMVRGDHQVARLSLNPEHLGPVDIKLNVSDDQARLWFTAQHPQAREALEAAVPRLREMFAQQGLDLNQHTSRDDAPRQDRDDRGGQVGAGAYRSHDDEAGVMPDDHRPRTDRTRRGLVDHFA